MASNAKRRHPKRRAAEHELEKALDQMHADKAMRVAARRVFADCLDKAKPVTFGTAQRRALDAAGDLRKESERQPDATAGAA